MKILVVVLLLYSSQALSQPVNRCSSLFADNPKWIQWRIDYGVESAIKWVSMIPRIQNERPSNWIEITKDYAEVKIPVERWTNVVRGDFNDIMSRKEFSFEQVIR